MWLIRFALFHVHEYCFHTYILTIIVQSHFLFYAQLKIHCFLFCLKIKFLILFLFFFLFVSGGFNFTLSAIVSCDGYSIDSGDDDDSGLDIRFVGDFYLSLSI